MLCPKTGLRGLPSSGLLQVQLIHQRQEIQTWMISLFDEVTFLFDLRYRNRCAGFASIELADVFRVDQIDFVE